METLGHDLKYAFRALRRSPGFALITVAILALGIGANTAIFSVINAVMVRTLPVRAPSELVHLLSVYPGEPRHPGFPWIAYEHYRDRNTVFADLIAVSPATAQLGYTGQDAESGQIQYVSGNFFNALGLKPSAGRLLAPQDDVPGAAGAAAAVLSWTTWQQRFSGDAGVAGRSIEVDGAPLAIVGVAPRRFSGVLVGYDPAVFLPAAAEPIVKRPSARATGLLPVAVVGRLRPGTSIEQAQAEMSVLDRWRVEQMASRSKDPLVRQIRMEVAPARSGIIPLRDRISAPLLVIMSIVGLLLLLACANVASMLLARGLARQRELAVRVALGAKPLRLARQALAESLLLSIAGAAVGIFIGVMGSMTLARIFTTGRRLPGGSEWTLDAGVDVNVLLFTVAVALLSGMLFGVAPALQMFAVQPLSTLRSNSRGVSPRSGTLLGRGLVVAQVTLSVVVASAAALFARHVSDLKHVDAGFRSDSVLLVSLDPSRSGHERQELSRLYGELIQRVTQIGGVESATLSGVTPIHGAGASRFVNVEGKVEDPASRRYVAVNWVAPRYFETFGTPLLTGRDFAAGDESRSPVAIINQAMAQHYFGDASPLGRHFTFDDGQRRYEIVGVVGNAKYYSLHEPAPRTVYLNAFQDAPGRHHQFALRTAVPPMRLAAGVRRVAQDVVKNVAIAKITTLDDQLNASLVDERLIAALSTAFGTLAVVLAAAGLYGLLGLAVSRRTSEIGVRMALGATPGDVRRLILSGAAGVVVTGITCGIPLAFWCRRIAGGLIPNLPSGMTTSFVVAAGALMLAAAFAVVVPVRRATRVDPVEALRHS